MFIAITSIQNPFLHITDERKIYIIAKYILLLSQQRKQINKSIENIPQPDILCPTLTAAPAKRVKLHVMNFISYGEHLSSKIVSETNADGLVVLCKVEENEPSWVVPVKCSIVATVLDLKVVSL